MDRVSSDAWPANWNGSVDKSSNTLVGRGSFIRCSYGKILMDIQNWGMLAVIHTRIFWKPDSIPLIRAFDIRSCSFPNFLKCRITVVVQRCIVNVVTSFTRCRWLLLAKSDDYGRDNNSPADASSFDVGSATGGRDSASGIACSLVFRHAVLKT
jgi:hypothetical protein